ncbi:hypothetical protein [Imhoffiella purpurea]|uniref:Uncharacterized protein n=1 Tax=Imhoffiella purpurea TaxID=1249627 RepID=W9V6I6_9GAMM|nr:hypothetical protein [Imhoffiella purpurea]EXJ15178.1 hypothetical protein D779_1732 [Imhoffiella purpurea]
MSPFGALMVGLFLPLFPFSMVFNRLFARLDAPGPRIGLLLLWPQIGILALTALGEPPPAWILWWAVATAALYALRALSVRDLGIWTGFMATSAWSLLWPAAALATPRPDLAVLIIQGLGLSLPLMLLAWLTAWLEDTFGAAYAGVCGGLGAALPRLSLLLTLAILAAVATPAVPGFFTLLSTSLQALTVMPGLALPILTVWLLWAWGGARILGGFIPGPACETQGPDLNGAHFRRLGLALVVLVAIGMGLSGELT